MGSLEKCPNVTSPIENKNPEQKNGSCQPLAGIEPAAGKEAAADIEPAARRGRRG